MGATGANSLSLQGAGGRIGGKGRDVKVLGADSAARVVRPLPRARGRALSSARPDVMTDGVPPEEKALTRASRDLSRKRERQGSPRLPSDHQNGNDCRTLPSHKGRIRRRRLRWSSQGETPPHCLPPFLA
ncbi:protein of unknown function [Bradyrhizobium vignae]|uniref:Uncharacterized protein n=1 Tax=Bradyrhizobium vignae TaxID=1549949 RepID=A0A2U3PRK5_9BRAD|nr:protein of unknown function [Bradyrhizobium vignae]